MLNDTLKEVFPETSEEYKTIIEAYDLVSTSAPTIAAEAKTNMILLDSTRIKLSSIYFMISRNISNLKATYQQTHDAEYKRLSMTSGLSNPSNTTVETIIRSKNPAYAGAIKKCEDLEDVKTFLSNILRCIDSSKQTALELLRDSRRLD